jgi:hypothetical protein
MDLSSGTIIRISNNAFLSLEELQQTDNGPITKIKVGFGQVWVILRGGSLEANTPSGVASVRGSYMSVNVDTETGEAFVTCLEGDCVMQTASGEMAMSAGQTAQVTNINSLPVPGHMTDEMVQEWLAFNPEATVVMMAVTATVRASRPDVALPDLACIADNSCVAYCTPPGYDPSSGALPGLDQFPPDCIDLAYTLLWQGVDPERFMTCFMLGGDMQTCANDAVRVVVPSSPSTGAPVVTLPDLACIATNDCSTFCMPSGWDPSSGETPPVEAIPPACVAAAESMYAQGVDPWLFIQCVVTYNEPQGCADAAVR